MWRWSRCRSVPSRPSLACLCSVPCIRRPRPFKTSQRLGVWLEEFRRRFPFWDFVFWGFGFVGLKKGPGGLLFFGGLLGGYWGETKEDKYFFFLVGLYGWICSGCGLNLKTRGTNWANNLLQFLWKEPAWRPLNSWVVHFIQFNHNAVASPAQMGTAWDDSSYFFVTQIHANLLRCLGKPLGSKGTIPPTNQEEITNILKIQHAEVRLRATFWTLIQLWGSENRCKGPLGSL